MESGFPNESDRKSDVMNRIAIIIPYFSKFNNYFKFWLESAHANQDVDFLVFTDNNHYACDGRYADSQNITFVVADLDNVRELTESNFREYCQNNRRAAV